MKLVTEDPPEGATRWTMEALAESMADHGVATSASQAWRIFKSLDLTGRVLDDQPRPRLLS